MSDTLLEIIARLQQPGAFSLAEGRHILLDQARKRARARLGLLFLLDPTWQHLLLVEQCGHAPRRARDAAPISVDGLFGAALREQGLLHIDENDHDPRMLFAERAWMWRGGRVLLCAVGVVAALDDAIDETCRQEMRRGVMALFTDARAPAEALSEKAEQDILLCAALLGSYLDVEDAPLQDADVTDADGLDAHKGHPYIWADRPASPDVPSWGVGVREMGALAAVYEAGLVDDADGERDEQVVCQRVVDALRDMLGATSGGLWLYALSRGQFVWRAGSGENRGIGGLVEDELAQVAGGLRQGRRVGREQRGARVVTWSPGRMVVLHMLEYGNSSSDSDTAMVGAVAFVIEGKQDVSEEQHLLLAYGCRAAAAVIRGWQRRAMERQVAIDAERSRIARDIHDGPAQQIAQAIHTLEYAGRVAERKPGLARQEIEQARVTLVESLSSLRQSIASLIPTRLEQASLDEALGMLLDEFRRNNPAIGISYEGYERAAGKRWPPSLDVPIYRLVQEALQNIHKHARAMQVTVQMRGLLGMAVVEIGDDGVGFDVAQARRGVAGGTPSHFGLRTMQERVEQAGGVFTLSSKPGEGTTVKGCFPLPVRAMALTGREREVLRLLVEGASNRAMAEQLSVSVETVKSHMHHIMQKLGVRDRTQAAVLAARRWV